jgi:hypothetical protein
MLCGQHMPDPHQFYTTTQQLTILLSKIWLQSNQASAFYVRENSTLYSELFKQLGPSNILCSTTVSFIVLQSHKVSFNLASFSDCMYVVPPDINIFCPLTHGLVPKIAPALLSSNKIPGYSQYTQSHSCRFLTPKIPPFLARILSRMSVLCKNAGTFIPRH